MKEGTKRFDVERDMHRIASLITKAMEEDDKDLINEIMGALVENSYRDGFIWHAVSAAQLIGRKLNKAEFDRVVVVCREHDKPEIIDIVEDMREN